MAVITSFARTLHDRVEARSVPQSPVQVKIPVADAHDDAPSDIGYAEGQSFIIEYEDAAGNESTRRITVWGIALGVGGVPVLVATCHERRMFRVDRITSCISYDGEVHDDVPQFMADAFGMQIPLASREIDQEEMALWQRVRQHVRYDAVLLVALSNADGVIHPAETEVALAHCEKAASAARLYLMEATQRSLTRYLNRLRPTAEDVTRATDELMGRDPQQVITLLTSAVHLVDADGRRHPAEIDMINDLAKELTGLAVI